MKWIGSWSEDCTKSNVSTQYKKLAEGKKRLVDYVNVLMSETDPLRVLNVFSYIENVNVILAQEMLRLKLLKL